MKKIGLIGMSHHGAALAALAASMMQPQTMEEFRMHINRPIPSTGRPARLTGYGPLKERGGQPRKEKKHRLKGLRP